MVGSLALSLTLQEMTNVQGPRNQNSHKNAERSCSETAIFVCQLFLGCLWGKVEGFGKPNVLGPPTLAHPGSSGFNHTTADPTLDDILTPTVKPLSEASCPISAPALFLAWDPLPLLDSSSLPQASSPPQGSFLWNIRYRTFLFPGSGLAHTHIFKYLLHKYRNEPLTNAQGHHKEKTMFFQQSHCAIALASKPPTHVQKHLYFGFTLKQQFG